MRTTTSNLTRSALFAAAALLSLSQSASAIVWDGGGTTNNFSEGLNWVGDVAIASGNPIVFAGSTRTTPNNDVSLVAADQAITFDSTAGAFTVGGGAIRSGAVTNSSSNFQIINNSLRFNGGRNFDTGASGMRLGSAPLSTGGARTHTKLGSGDLELTYTGSSTQIGWNVNAGRLVVANATGTQTIPNLVTVNSSGTLLFSQAGTSSLAGGVAGAGPIVKNSAGTSTISGPNTHTGNVSVQSGVLTFASAYTANSASTTTLNLKGAATPVAGTDFGQIVASNAAYTYGGLLSLNFTDAAIVGSTYNLFLATGTGSVVGSFTGVGLTGTYTGSLTDSGGGVFTGLLGGLNFTFTSSTGSLFVAVPEPATCAALAGVLALGFAAWRRRKA